MSEDAAVPFKFSENRFGLTGTANLGIRLYTRVTESKESQKECWQDARRGVMPVKGDRSNLAVAIVELLLVYSEHGWMMQPA
jgi:hypothetical protein